jgi:phage host-nuclease inhibitor protein Gam
VMYTAKLKDLFAEMKTLKKKVAELEAAHKGARA